MDDAAASTTSSTTETVAEAADTTALGSADATQQVDTAADAATTDTTTADAATDADKSADAADADKGDADQTAEIPEAYDLKLEGVELDPAMVETATPVFKELGLSNDQANKLMPVAQDFAKKIGDAHNQQILAAVTAERKAWLDTAKADPEIGGQNFDGNLVTAAKALDALGMGKGSSFRALLDDSGLGNHPEMIRAFVKVGKAIGEDSDFTRGGGQPAQQNVARILYPNDPPKGQ